MMPTLLQTSSASSALQTPPNSFTRGRNLPSPSAAQVVSPAAADSVVSSPRATPLFNIPPPPESIYPCREEAETALHRWTKSHGYNLSKKNAAYVKGSNKLMHTQYYECDRAGKPKNTGNLTDSERVRVMCGSKRSGCPMTLKVCAVDKKQVRGRWAVVHHKKGSCVHNHLPSKDVRIHAAHRRRAANDVASAPLASIEEFVRAQTAAGIAVANIHASLLVVDPGSLITPKDLANVKSTVRQKDIATRTPMEALFDELEKHRFHSRYSLSPETNQIRHMIWAHPDTTILHKLHHDVLVLDCTYKTNRYNLPLLNIIAMTGLNTALPVAQCWLPGEVEEDFEWALSRFREYLEFNGIPLPSVIVTDRCQACMNALKRVLPTVPTLLCKWHMNRNVLSKTREVLGQIEVDQAAPGQDRFENTWQTDSFMASYYDAVNSETEAEFEDHRKTLASKSPEVAKYLELHWWKYKEMIVRCWTKRYRHFGYQVTSAVEGTHARCKRWLQTSRGDLYSVFRKLLPWWISSVRALSLLSERNATIAPYRLQANRYTAVVRIVTIWALNATDKLWKEAVTIINQRRERTLCSGSFRRTHGRPCVHELIRFIESNGTLKLKPSDYDLHWWVRRDLPNHAIVRIEEPAVIRNKPRKSRSHKAKHGQSGTARDPILSERTDRNHPSTPPRTWTAPQATLEFQGSLPSINVMLGGFNYTHGTQFPPSEFQTPAEIFPFIEVYAPSRAWGYAGLRPFQ